MSTDTAVQRTETQETPDVSDAQTVRIGAGNIDFQRLHLTSPESDADISDPGVVRLG